MQNYINNAEKIYSKDNVEVLAVGIKQEGKTSMRLHVKNGNELCQPITICKTKLNNVSELMDYMDIDLRGVREIKEYLRKKWFDIPCIQQCDNIGYQRNGENKITAFMGAKCFDENGREIVKDMFSSLPLPAYSKTNNKPVNFINQYMQKNIKRQIVLVHALAGAVCGMIKQNILLALIGKSSTGKTTLETLGVSFFTQPDYDNTVLNWNATSNALVKRMDGLSGVHILIDDTQLSRINTYGPIIYSLREGKSKDRLHKGNELCPRNQWSVSIGITAEKSLLDTFKHEGAVARMIELPVQDSDLFDNEKEVRLINEFYEKNHGVIGSAFVKLLLQKYNEDSLKRYVATVSAELCERFSKNNNTNHINIRHLDEDIAIMICTAKLLNENLQFQFDINRLSDTLYSLCKENYRTFNQNNRTSIQIMSMYQHLLKLGMEKYPEYRRGNQLIIPSAIMKRVISDYANLLKTTPSSIKNELESQGLLAKKNGGYCWNHTINNKDVTGYTLNIKEAQS